MNIAHNNFESIVGDDEDELVVMKGTTRLKTNILLKWEIQKDSVEGFNWLPEDADDIELMNVSGFITKRYSKEYNFGFGYTVFLTGYLPGNSDAAFSCQANVINLQRASVLLSASEIMTIFDWDSYWDRLHREIFSVSSLAPIDEIPGFCDSESDTDLIIDKLNEAFNTDCFEFTEFPNLILIDHICKNSKICENSIVNADLIFSSLLNVLKKVCGSSDGLIVLTSFPLQYPTEFSIHSGLYERFNLSQIPSTTFEQDRDSLVQYYKSIGFKFISENNMPAQYKKSNEDFLYKHFTA